MPVLSDIRDDGRVVYHLTGAGLTGIKTLGQLPAGCVVTRVFTVTGVAGTGSSAPTLKVGTTVDDDKYVASATPGVTNGVGTHTVICTGGFNTVAEGMIATLGGTMPTNATYDAWLVIEFLKLTQA